MPLDKAGLEAGLKSLQADMETRNENAKDEWAKRMANLFDVFVKSGDVQAGIAVQVTPSSGSGATVATGKII